MQTHFTDAFERMFRRKSGVLLGVIHLLPLPGTAKAPARASDAMNAAIERGLADALALEAGGVDGAIVENFGDAPFHGGPVPASIVAALTRATAEIRRRVRMPLGVNVLRNDADAALAIAAACGCDFVRVNVHVGAMLTDQGVLEGRAAHTLSERRRLGASNVLVLADILVKHATPLAGTREALLPQLAEDTYRRGLADALIVTGAGTGKTTPLRDVAIVRAAVPEAPVLVGSGVTEDSVRATLEAAHGAIVGTWFKRQSRVSEPVDAGRVARLVARARPDRAKPAHVRKRSGTSRASAAR